MGTLDTDVPARTAKIRGRTFSHFISLGSLQRKGILPGF